MNDAEEGFVLIEPMAAEHPSRLDAVQLSQLIQTKSLNDSSAEVILLSLFRND